MVNDRGPFSKDRIIDMSERAADILDFKKKGTTKVRVQFLPEQTARLLKDVPGAKGKDFVKSNHATPVIERNNKASTPGNNFLSSPSFVQVGTYKSMKNAKNIKKALSSLGNVRISTVKANNKLFYKVKIGPISDKKSAELILKKTIKMGNRDAFIAKEDA
jgi:rare lipoprotein A